LCGAALGPDDRPLTPLLRWNAGRDRAEIDAFIDRLGAMELYRATGVPSGPKTPLAIWLDLRKREPEVWAAMRRWAGVADLVALDLTGDLVTDHTFAARTMAYRLPTARAPLPEGFDDALLGEAGVRPSQLPRIAPCGEAAGLVTASAAAATDLAQGTPVYVCGHDHAVASWAAGARELGTDADSMGTSEALVRMVDDVNRDAVGSAGMSLSRSVDGVAQTLLAGMAGSGAVLEWWFDRVLPGVERRRVFAAIDRQASGPGDVLVLPYPTGRQTPAPDPGATLRVLDVSGGEIDAADRAPEQLTRGLLVGLSLQLRWMRDEQNRLAGGTPASSPVVVGGPGAANRTWLRIKSEVLGTTLATVDANEPVASGAALLALVRDGRVPATTALRVGEAASPTPPGSDPYAAAYETFVAAATGRA
jgi:xylulokinase